MTLFDRIISDIVCMTPFIIGIITLIVICKPPYSVFKFIVHGIILVLAGLWSYVFTLILSAQGWFSSF